MKNYLVMMMTLMFISYGAGEVKHSPSEIEDGETLRAWIDTEDEVAKVSFFVCDTESGVCYQPETRSKEENEQNSRYEFEYEVQNGVKPAYRYTVEYEDEEESKIPKLGVIYDEQEVIDIGGSLYFEVRIAEVEEENGIPTLGITISSMIIICLSIIYKKK
tara:strand:- start:67 stop:549 length:483 start_codon:yes stop_codon:yes gene_type:complete